MEPLSPEVALKVWERGLRASTTRRALILLSAGGEEETELQNLPLGERDRRLLELRAATFGPQMTAISRCPRCAEELELRLEVADLLQPAPAETLSANVALEAAPVRFRLPTSLDLLAVEEVSDPVAAEQVLLGRCLLSVASEEAVDTSRGQLQREEASGEARRCVSGSAEVGRPSWVSGLSTEDRQELAQAMSEADPLAEVLLDLTCGSCGEAWQELFEIAEFLYQEVSLLAHRLLRDVAELARCTGWTESEILAMSPTRRQVYLELLSA